MGHRADRSATPPTVDQQVDPADARTWPQDPEAGRRIVLALSAEAEELRRQTLHDDLTGLANRALLDDRLETALHAARRSGEPCAVMVMDLDGFKAINDTYGHAAGDIVLREVAARLSSVLRAQDTAARLGGDEFAVVLPNTDTEGAIRTAKRIVARLHVGASIGIAVFPDDGATAEELLAHADQAMYRAKRAGGGYLLFTPGADVVVHGGAKTRRKGYRRHGVVGVALALAIMTGAMTPTGVPLPSDKDSAARLQAAAVALEAATAEQVDEMVADLEHVVGEITWQEVAVPKVVAALGKAEEALDTVKEGAPPRLGQRVDRLLVTIHQAAAMPELPERPLPEPSASIAPEPSPA